MRVRYIRNGCAKKGEATLLAKVDCTEIERVEARVLLSEAVARPSKRASWLLRA